MTIDLEQISEELDNGNNPTIDLREISTMGVSYISEFGSKITYIFGKPIKKTDGDYFVIFNRCQWCYSIDGKVDSRNNCAHCGAPIR